MSQIWINGKVVQDDQPHINSADGGFLHGLGLFTSLVSLGGVPQYADRHLSRLRASSERLDIPLVYSDEVLLRAMTDLVTGLSLADARVRITLTPGRLVADPVHGRRNEPTCVISAGAFEPYPADLFKQGMAVAVADFPKLNSFDPQAGHKTTSGFVRIAALRQAVGRKLNEALLFDVHNLLQSAAMGNVFLVKDSSVLTPPTQEDLQESGLLDQLPRNFRSNVIPGITRLRVKDACHGEGIAFTARLLTINDLLAAEEVFLANSVMGIMPVSRVEGHPVGASVPGELTTRLIARLGGGGGGG